MQGAACLQIFPPFSTCSFLWYQFSQNQWWLKKLWTSLAKEIPQCHQLCSKGVLKNLHLVLGSMKQAVLTHNSTVFKNGITKMRYSPLNILILMGLEWTNATQQPFRTFYMKVRMDLKCPRFHLWSSNLGKRQKFLAHMVAQKHHRLIGCQVCLPYLSAPPTFLQFLYRTNSTIPTHVLLF